MKPLRCLLGRHGPIRFKEIMTAQCDVYRSGRRVWTCDTCGKEIARTYQMGLRPDIKFGERVLTDTIVKGVYETD